MGAVFIIIGFVFGLGVSVLAWMNPSQSPPLGGGVLQTDTSGLKIVTTTQITTGNFTVNNGNVGIGTTTPTYKLQVEGTFSLSDGSMMITSTDTLSTLYGLISTRSGGTAYTSPDLAGSGSGLVIAPLWNASGTIVLNSNFSSTAPTMFLNSTGNVGIGTTAPLTKLHASSFNLQIASTTGETILAEGDDTGLGLYSRWHSTCSSYINLTEIDPANGQFRNKWTIERFATPNLGFNPDASFRIGYSTVNGYCTGPYYLTILPNGNVGIGTTSPSASLQIQTSGTSFPDGWNSNLKLSGIYPSIWLKDTDNNSGFVVGQDYATLYFMSENANAKNLYAMVINGTSGNVGIGTTEPENQLSIESSSSIYALGIGQISGQENARRLLIGYDTINNYASILAVEENVAYRPLVLQQYGGNVGIGTTAPAKTLQVKGATMTDMPGTGTGWAVCKTSQTGTTNQELVDCTSAPAADYAEMYPLETAAEPGDLVVFGSELVSTYRSEGGEIKWDQEYGKVSRLVRSTQPYENGLVGIVSDKSMLTDFNVIGHNIAEKDNPQPIALMGRVLAKVSTENGPIRIGDPLTSSSKPGVAMRATKPGRVIGYALAPFENTASEAGIIKEGKILVFVNPGYWAEEMSFLEKLGLKLEKGVAYIKELITERITTKTARLERLEMKDQVTGEIYCIWIERGDWQKQKGLCP